MILVAAVSACATPTAPDLITPLGSTCTHVAAVGGDAPHPATPPPYEAQRLVGAVAQVASGALDVKHLAETLQRLADSVAIVAPTEVADVDQIRHAADELLRSLQGFRIGNDQQIHIALGATLHALQSAQPFYDYDRERFRHAVAMLAMALDTAPIAVPTQSQRDDEVAALKQATRAIYVAIGAQPPFGPEATASAQQVHRDKRSP